ncbi:MAG: phosphoadenylyl-sulfate reductase [Bacteroidales bacterium]|jgi:phosphoadenosine phosphosulfate reductase|nr:phosphoadenylyl-sulfate reductase [Bacteroidales bacterium]MCU0408034.1 phosphoadenylyl-sulfate reductase [Bacteroidales bacterium]
MRLEELKDELESLPVSGKLKKLAGMYQEEIIFTSSFGIEDQVITDIIFRNDINITVATLDTGRLFPETYKVFSKTLDRYRKKIKVFFPGQAEAEKMVTEKGPYSFYESKENRQECCRIRKVYPLNRALEGMKCWITGIRAEQSGNRSGMDDLEYDNERMLFKFHPIFYWTHDEVERYIRDNNVPYNILHDKGFPSIGCEPCTRAVAEGEDFRSGRWWWENEGKKECGLHSR